MALLIVAVRPSKLVARDVTRRRTTCESQARFPSTTREQRSMAPHHPTPSSTTIAQWASQRTKLQSKPDRGSAEASEDLRSPPFPLVFRGKASDWRRVGAIGFSREKIAGAVGRGGRVGATPRGRGCAWQEHLDRPPEGVARDMLVCASIQAARHPRTKL